jgi:DNA-binding transcriptional MerR regulator
MELENKEYEIDDIRKSCEKYKEQANAKQSTNEKLSPNNMMTNVNCIKCDERKQQFDEMVDKKEDEIEKQKRKVDDRDNIIDNLRLMLKDKLNAGDIFDFDYALALTKLGHQVGHISRPISDSLVIIDNELRIQGKTNKKFMPKDDELFFCRRKLILENTTLPTTNQPNVTEETETTQN